MRIPGQLVPLIKEFEGFHRIVQRNPILAAPYLCPAGYWTIGYGILCGKDDPPITLEEGEAMLAARLPAYVAHALRLSPGLAAEPDARLASIADFIFNLGPTQYAGSTLRKRVNTRQWQSAAGELRRWIWGGGRKLPGLIRRRAREAEMLLSISDYPSHLPD